MALVFGDRIKETSTTTGTGSLTLAGAADKHRAFSAVLSNNDTCTYYIVHQSANEWETGLGTWTTGGYLARTTVYASSTGSKVDFSAGTKDVAISITASRIQALGTTDSPTFVGLSLSGLTASKVVFTDSGKALTSTGIGTSSQFIKGDGSLDSSIYAASGHNHDLTYQPLDSDLTSIAGLGTASNKMLYTTSAHTWAEASITAAGRDILDDANAAAQCTTLGLGTGDSPTFRGVSLTHTSAPSLTIYNTTPSDAPGARDCIIYFKGTQSGSETSYLAQIRAEHLGTSDDEKGILKFYVNDGNDGTSPTNVANIGIGFYAFPQGAYFTSYDTGTGFLLKMNYNVTNHKQLLFGDPDYLGNSAGTFIRIPTLSGISYIDCINGDSTAQKPLRFMTAGGIYISAAHPNTMSVAHDTNGEYDLWINYNGYQDSTTQYRTLKISDGKQRCLAQFRAPEIADDPTLKLNHPANKSYGTVLSLYQYQSGNGDPCKLHFYQCSGNKHCSIGLDSTGELYVKQNGSYSSFGTSAFSVTSSGSLYTYNSSGNTNNIFQYDGRVYFYNITATDVSANPLVRYGTYEIIEDTSSIRVKTAISKLEIDTSDLYLLQMKSYTCIHSPERRHGYIAEDCASVAPWLAIFRHEEAKEFDLNGLQIERKDFERLKIIPKIIKTNIVTHYNQKAMLPAVIEELKRLARFNDWLIKKLNIKDIPEEFKVFAKASS